MGSPGAHFGSKLGSTKGLSFLGCLGSFNGGYRRVTGDSLATNGLFTLRNRPILINLSQGIKTPTPLILV